uniref:Uncharacterized protein n=1 Tax=Candidozyma auris TaxID=498019 RepID=A0A0L0NNZ1_CANAR
MRRSIGGPKIKAGHGDLIFGKAEEIKDRIATAGRIHARIRNQGEGLGRRSSPSRWRSMA